MYKIRFTNNEDKVITATIANKKDLAKITNKDAKNAIIDCKIGDNMPVALHNAIADHNSKVRGALAS